jgi:hypothetical protein
MRYIRVSRYPAVADLEGPISDAYALADDAK